MNSTTNKLSVSTPSDLEIVMTRGFDAPRDLVFEAFSKPEHLRKWWGGCGEMRMVVCEVDFRVGGKWRFALELGGEEYGFNGVYHEIVPPEKIVNTQIYEPFPTVEVVVTLELHDRDGKTWMVETLLHKSKEDRDAHLQTGMEEGAAGSLDALDDLLAELQDA